MTKEKICPSCLQLHNRTTIRCAPCQKRLQRILDTGILTSQQTIKNLTSLRFALGPFQQIHKFNESIVSDLRNLHSLCIESIQRIDTVNLKTLNIEDRVKALEQSLHYNDIKEEFLHIQSRYSIRLVFSKWFDYSEDVFYLGRLLQQRFRELDAQGRNPSEWNADPLLDFNYSNPKDSKATPRAKVKVYDKIDHAIGDTEIIIEYSENNN